MLTASLTAYRRPDYLAKSIDSWRKLDWSDFSIMEILLEPWEGPGKPHPEVYYLCNSIDFIETKIRTNNNRFGCTPTTWEVIDNAFFFSLAYSDSMSVNLHLEDDVVLGQDALNLVKWFSELENKEDYLALCLYNRGSDKSKDQTKIIEESKTFPTWGFAMSEKVWHNHFSHGWPYPQMWDWGHQMARLMKEYDLTSLRPLVSRSNHIGKMCSRGPKDLIEVPNFDQNHPNIYVSEFNEKEFEVVKNR